MTKPGLPVSRRSLLIGMGSTGALALSGCDRLSQSPTVRDILASSEKLSLASQRTFLSANVLAREYAADQISKVFRANGSRDARSLPPSYPEMVETGLSRWRLRVDGLVHRPLELSLSQLRALPSRSQTTRHDCVEGWSCIGGWRGSPLGTVLDLAGLRPEARFIVFHCADEYPRYVRGREWYYESIDLADAFHPQTILAYDMNGSPLPLAHGAPLRLRVERQLGYKMAKFISRIEVVSSFDHIRGGGGGYWEDRGYEWYAGI